MSKTTWYLQQIDLFSGINDSEIAKIAQNVTERKCHKKEFLYTPHDKQSGIHILKKGEITLYYSHYGKKLIIDILKPGSVFGDLNFTDQQTDHFAEVTEEAQICTFTKEDFINIIKAHPEITLRLLKIVSTRLADYEKRMKSGLFDAREKIIHYLELREEKIAKSFFRRKTKMTHQKIAAHVGLSRETVTRALSSLRKEGKIYDCEIYGICLTK